MIRCFQSSSEVVLADAGVIGESKNKVVEGIAASSLNPEHNAWPAESPSIAGGNTMLKQHEAAAETMGEGILKRMSSASTEGEDKGNYSPMQQSAEKGGIAAREKKRARFEVSLSATSR